MNILSVILLLFFSIYPSNPIAPENSLFICKEEVLNATIYNNQNGSATIVEPMGIIDAGAFVVLNWGELNLMLPRTFNKGEKSFTDGKWLWAYGENDKPELRLRNRNGVIEDFSCEVKSLKQEVL